MEENKCVAITRPKVSVAVPTFNQGQWLAECLESIVSQKTNFSFEILVGDDASSDSESRRILANYASRFPNMIIPIWNEKNIGPYENMLHLYRCTRGNYIAHCDGDDMMLPGKLQKQADYLDAHPDFSMVGHRMWGMSSDGKRIQNTAGFGKKVLTVDDILRNGTPFANSSSMFRKSHQTIWTSKVPVIDFLLIIDRALCGPVGVIDEFLGVYREGVGIGTSSYDKIEEATRYALQYALEHGCNSDIVSAGRKQFEIGFAAERLRRSVDLFHGFPTWDWHVWSKIYAFRFKYGVLGAYLLQKWPHFARAYLQFWFVWLGHSWFWRKTAIIHSFASKCKKCLSPSNWSI